MWPRALLAHERQRGVRAVQEAEAVDVDHPPPLVGVGALDGPEQHHAGVVDEGVEAAELLARALDERPRAGLVGDVGLDRRRPRRRRPRSARRAPRSGRRGARRAPPSRRPARRRARSPRRSPTTLR